MMALARKNPLRMVWQGRGRAVKPGFIRLTEQQHYHLRERLPPDVLDDLLALERSSRPPRVLSLAAKTKSLGNMQHMDAGASVKVGDGAREPERAVIPAR
jgi:hypothetical protein